MRKWILASVLIGCGAVAPAASACEPRGGGQVQIIIDVPAPSAAASQQSQALLAEAVRLEAKARLEDSGSATVLLSAKAARQRAASLRLQADLLDSGSRALLLAKAERLEVDAAVSDADSATFLARARLIRSRAKSLRTLSSQVLASGVITAPVLARMKLPAAPASHPDKKPLVALDAAPLVPAATTKTTVAQADPFTFTVASKR